MLPEVVLLFLDAIVARREGYTDTYCGGVVFDKQEENVTDTRLNMLECHCSDYEDYGFALEGGR